MILDESKMLHGTVLIGAPCTGKTYLMQHRALKTLREQEDGRLVYVGGAMPHRDPIVARAPGSRVVADALGLFVVEGDRMLAFFASPIDSDNEVDVAAEGRRMILDTLRYAKRPNDRNKYILAIDEVFFFFRTDEEQKELFTLLEEVLDSPVPHLKLLVSFQSVMQIHSAFGMAGVELFARLHEKFIFKYFNAAEFEDFGFASCGSANPSLLNSFEAIHVLYNTVELVDISMQRDAVVVGEHHELRPVGFWRRREIRNKKRLAGLMISLLGHRTSKQTTGHAR